MPTLPYTPQPTPDAVMRSIMARYHADMEAQVEHTLADLQYRWRGVAANLANTISQLESKMAAAERAGIPIDYAWLSQERRLLDLKSAVEGDIARYAQGAKAIIGDAQVAAVASGSESALAALQATEPPGLGYTWGVPPEGVLHQIAGATQPYSPLSQLFDEFGPQASAAAQQALFQSVALGEGAKMAAQRLVYATNMSAQRAEVIARTEIMRSWRHAQMANYQANSDVVSGWIWNCDISPRSCPACLSMDGSIHGLDEELDDHVCGRCSAQPITRPWSEVLAGTGVSDEELASLDEMEADTMPARETGADWLARQEPAIQNRIMGPAAAEAYRRGDVTLAQLTGITHDPLWGSSIQTRSLRELGLDAQKYLQLARDGERASVLADAAALERAAEGTPQQLWREWAAAHNIPDITTAGEGRMATPEEIAAATKRQAEAYREWQRSLASNLPREEGETAFAPLSTPGGHGEVRVYDLTAADRAFLNELRGVVPEGGVTSVDEALALGQPLAERINASLADLRAYAEEERLIYQMAPNLTDAQRAWAMGEREATAAHGGVSWTKAAQEFQAAYQAQVRAYLSAFRETGGVELNMATDAEKFDALVATRLDAASQMLPADWLQASNDLGELNVLKYTGRDAAGEFVANWRGGGDLAVRYLKNSDIADLESTALHELTHRMEQVIPQLSDLETEFYTARTAGEEFVDLTNGIKQQTKLDEWLDEYLGRAPLSLAHPGILQADGTYAYTTKSYELMTMGVEMALAPGASAATFALQADSEYEAFVLGALMGVRAPVAEAVTTAAEDEAAAAVRAAENEIAYAARRAAGTALSDAERSAIQDAVASGDLPKSYGKYTSVEQLVKTAKGREWYAANATVKAEAKAAEEVATAARTVLTDAERQALKDAVASGDLPKSYGKYTSVEQLTKTARGRAWYEANAALKAEETTAAQAAALTGVDLQAEAAVLRGIFTPDFENTHDVDAIMQSIVQRESATARALADNPAWQRYVQENGFQGYEFAGQTITPEMQAVGSLENSWRTAVADEAPVNVALRQIAQEEFNLTIPAREIDASVQAQADQFISEYGGALRAYVHTVYDQTQQWFADQGITELTVYRGFTSQTPLEGLVYDGTATEMSLAGAPFSSYSVDPELAYGYAATSAPGFMGGDYRALIVDRIPVSDILANPFTSGMPSRLESEVLVFGNARTASVVAWQGAEAPGLTTALDQAATTLNADVTATTATEVATAATATTEADAAQAAINDTLTDTLRLVSRDEAQAQAQQMNDLINPARGESVEATKARIARDITARLADNPAFTDFGAKLRAGLADLVNGQRNLTATMKADAIRIIERDFADKNVARQLVSAWAQMDTPLYSAIQQAIRDEFNMADAWAPSVADQNMRWAEKYLGDLQPGLRAFAREMYNNTQEYFAEQGITEVPLYRGMYFDKPPTGLDWKALRDNYLVMRTELQAASSFSTDPATAYWFAANGRYQVVLAARVPVEQIIGTTQTGFGSRAEYEMVVLGSLDQAWAIGRYKTLTLDDALNLLTTEHQ